MRTLRANPGAVILPRHIYILAGQSNMSGRGELNELPSFTRAGRVKIFSNAWHWVAGSEPVDSPVGQVDSVSLDSNAAASPSMAFGDALAGLTPDVEIGLVPCAKGGSSLDDWSRNLSRSTLYGSMFARSQEAAKDGEIKGVILYQGENDADTLEHANTWASRCYELIADVRADLGIPNLPFIVTVLGPDPEDPLFPYHSLVQSQQQGMSGLGIAVVSAADLTGKVGDPIHLDTGSLVTLGQRYATAMQGLLA